MKDILFFDKMLTPKIITLVYWLLLLSALGGGLGLIIAGNFFSGIGAAIGGSVFARIFCELMIVAFKMNEALQDIRSK